MKNLFLLLLSLFTVVSVQSQWLMPGQIETKSDMNKTISIDEAQILKSNQFETRAGSDYYWLNYVDALDFIFAAGETNTVMLWPDSTVRYVVDQSHPDHPYFYWWQHAMGQSFHPVTEYMRDWMRDPNVYGLDNVDDWYNRDHAYHIDSVSLYFFYDKKRAENDTLRISIVHPGHPDVGNYYVPEYPNAGDSLFFTGVPYEWTRNAPPVGPMVTEIKRVLTDADSSMTSLRKITVPVNITIPANPQSTSESLVSITADVIPGYSYSLGDTLRQFIGATVSNKLNNVFLLTYEEQTGGFPYTWDFRNNNHGLFINTNLRYELSNWGIYYPTYVFGDGFNDEHLYVDFRTRAIGADYSTSGDVCVGQSVSFTDESNHNPSSWNWNFDDGNTSTDQNPTHTFTSPGTYEVCLTSSGGGDSYTQCKTFTVQYCSGIEDNEKAINTSIYPNPANNLLHIDITGETLADYTVEISNIQGKVVYNTTFDNAVDVSASVNTNSFTNGVYFVRITSGDKVTTKRVVVNH